jgi:hypothetical protein
MSKKNIVNRRNKNNRILALWISNIILIFSIILLFVSSGVVAIYYIVFSSFIEEVIGKAASYLLFIVLLSGLSALVLYLSSVLLKWLDGNVLVFQYLLDGTVNRTKIYFSINELLQFLKQKNEVCKILRKKRIERLKKWSDISAEKSTQFGKTNLPPKPVSLFEEDSYYNSH